MNIPACAKISVDAGHASGIFSAVTEARSLVAGGTRPAGPVTSGTLLVTADLIPKGAIMLPQGTVVAFDYPAANFACVHRPRLERRTAIVREVRDTFAVPLEAATINAEPYLNRGRFLITCWDLDRKAERSFWDESMQNLQALAITDLGKGGKPHENNWKSSPGFCYDSRSQLMGIENRSEGTGQEAFAAETEFSGRAERMRECYVASQLKDVPAVEPEALPKLRIDLFENGRLAGHKDIDDPREELCREINKQGKGFGVTASAHIESNTPG